MQDHFFAMADATAARLRGDEGFLATFRGETSQFVRFNKSAVRQPGTVEQRTFGIELFRGKRHASASVSLTGAPSDDLARVDVALTTEHPLSRFLASEFSDIVAFSGMRHSTLSSWLPKPTISVFCFHL